MSKRFLMSAALAVTTLASTGGAWAAEAAEQFKPTLVPIPPGPQDKMAALWVIIIFVIMLLILYPTAWKNVLAGLKAREERIRKDIADAEATRIKSEQTLGQYNTQLATAEQKVRDLLAQAASDAQKIADNIRTRAGAEAEEIKERASKEIEAAKQGALREIYDQTANLATAVAEKIIRRNLNADDQRDLVTQSLDQLSSGRN